MPLPSRLSLSYSVGSGAVAAVVAVCGGCTATAVPSASASVVYPVAISQIEPAGAVETPAPPVQPPPELVAAPLPSSSTDARSSYAVDLPTALHLSNARPLDVQLAAQRIRAAQAQLDQAKALWIPTIYLGVDYARHDGQLQDIAGRVFNVNRSSLMAGVGPSAVFSFGDAWFAPQAAEQVVRARQYERQTSVNDVTLSVATAYFDVQQARGEVAGALDSARRAEELLVRTQELTSGLVPKIEVNRTRAELSRRRQAVESAYGRWESSSAELGRVLRLPAAAAAAPVEPPHLQIELVDLKRSIDELVVIGLTNRPELENRQALVAATLTRLKQEKLRPLTPSLLLRGNGTNPAGTLSTGAFGGGERDDMQNFGARNSLDVQILWELRNLGFGNAAAVREREAESRAAVLEMFAIQDRVAAEVVQAHSQAQRAFNRIRPAEEGLVDAIETAHRNVEGMSQTRRAGDVLILVFRPQEVVASIQSLDLAYRDYFGAVGDYNRAQFRLYRALGCPAQCLSRLHEDFVGLNVSPLPSAGDASAPPAAPVDEASGASAPRSVVEAPTPSKEPVRPLLDAADSATPRLIGVRGDC